MGQAVIEFVDRNPRWFATGLIIHTMIVVGLLAAPVLIAR